MPANTLLIDSTVLIRLVLGKEGADFAINVFSRAEEGVEDVVIPSTALVEALSKAAVAAASSVVGGDVKEGIEALYTNINAREKAVDVMEKLLSYIMFLHKTGRVTIYSVGADDIEHALELMKKNNLNFSDAITLAVAEKLRIQKIATFSKKLRQVTGYTFLPSA
ncbi:hypothetical protein PYJP_04550 [Pyrofollis japonicus]|uniref:type II toxin-antitoxin system VapC family toxin n=1 Tax=Pyrofollis japonicus TaxID=3060460 RepID=UPI00295BEF44|nr:type II toxin-antitoxin system VapC family toxin [Pyrofollis japonicus]BEP17103.1 hypothetical protein PYJP_04550 [Pyrofollis japonicus]